MLVLNRKIDEKIKIGDDVIINVLDIDSNSVKIGIKAPKDVVILRMEVYEKILKQNIESASKQLSDITHAADLIKSKFSGEG